MRILVEFTPQPGRLRDSSEGVMAIRAGGYDSVSLRAGVARVSVHISTYAFRKAGYLP